MANEDVVHRVSSNTTCAVGIHSLSDLKRIARTGIMAQGHSNYLYWQISLA